MFTGIVEQIGMVQAVKKGIKSSELTISFGSLFDDIKLGDSIAVNGVCLTVRELSPDYFKADVMAESIRRSNLGILKQGSLVNLERAMAAGSRFGGHIVSGHIDGSGTIVKIEREENALWFTIKAAPELLKYIVHKGSVALDGISLTVAAVGSADFSVSVIPHTMTETVLIKRKVGDSVNLECDIIGKYVEKLLNKQEAPIKSNVTGDLLIKHGFI